jgi:hypothetical protein
LRGQKRADKNKQILLNIADGVTKMGTASTNCAAKTKKKTTPNPQISKLVR